MMNCEHCGEPMAQITETMYQCPYCDTTRFKNIEKPKYEIHKAIVLELNELYKAKNNDYGDSFAILRGKYPNAILIRLYDKLLRLETLLNGTSQQVKDESITDTLKDIANYALMEIVERQIERNAK